MGEQKVSLLQDQEQKQLFVRNLLNDVKALEHMLENDWFESDVIRIGAEQEMCLINTQTFKPAPIAMEALEKMKDYEWVETELARFNLETNLKPRVFKGSCISSMEKENASNLKKIRKKLQEMGADVLLAGILPTLRPSDLEMHNLTPKKRYEALMQAMNEHLQREAYEFRLTGIDELRIEHGSPLLEACNTSFQVHLQVAPNNFVKLYNIAQALTGPVMAVAANSPLVFGRRLWHETRIALFQQALDTRRSHKHMRERLPRVNFGKDWLKESIMEIYQDDIARFPVLITGDVKEKSLELIEKGKVPKLRALQVHNSTVYRWNRPCYGVSGNGKPHLRIENRVIPAGPTVTDEFANAAFWLGAMVGMANRVEDIRDYLSYEDVRDNFSKGAHSGIDTKFNWFKDAKISARELLLKELIPISREGLEAQKVDKDDIDRYLGIIEERAKKHQNGARWQLRSFTNLVKQVSKDEAISVMTASMYKNQWKGDPIHTWELPEVTDLESYQPTKLKVEEFMETDLFTVREDDIIELVADLMDWRKIRYMPVEDTGDKLVGLITSRLLLRHFTKKNNDDGSSAKFVKDIMIKDPITISPDATILEAMYTMRDNRIGCLPVIKDNELIGIITEMEFLRISGSLIERLERQ